MRKITAWHSPPELALQLLRSKLSIQPHPIMAAKKTTKKAAKKAAKKTVTKTAKRVAKKAATKEPNKTTKKTAKKAATFEQIAAEAYCIYRDRVAKGLPGNPDSDWLAAEKKLTA